MEERGSPQQGKEGYEGQVLGRHEVQQRLPRVKGQVSGHTHREQSSGHAPCLPYYEAGITVSEKEKIKPEKQLLHGGKLSRVKTFIN